MRVQIYLGLLFLVISCAKTENKLDKATLLGNDYRLFQGTPVWDLAKAIRDEDVTEIRKIVKYTKPEIDYQESKFGNTLLMLTIANGQYSSCKTLLELGANPNMHDNYDGSSPIIDAAGAEDIFGTKFLELLLKYGANPNDEEVGDRREGNTQRNTPLLTASGKNLERVKILIKAGADINYTNEFGTTPLSHAFIQDRYDITLYLLRNKANFKVPIINRDGKNIYLQEMLRELLLPLDSDEYQLKMEIANFLKMNGIDYKKVPIPDYVVSEAKKKYPENWSEYLEKY